MGAHPVHLQICVLLLRRAYTWYMVHGCCLLDVLRSMQSVYDIVRSFFVSVCLHARARAHMCVQTVGRLPSCQSILEVGLVSAAQSSLPLL